MFYFKTIEPQAAFCHFYFFLLFFFRKILAQLVEHCTSIVEVMGSISKPHFHYCLVEFNTARVAFT